MTSMGHESLDAETDRFTSLPSDIIDLILSYLPLDEAVKTSVLSKRWRHMWKTIPDIIFDQECFTLVVREQDVMSNELKLVKTITKVLNDHSGMITKFRILHPNFTPRHAETDGWIKCLVSSPVREFSLTSWRIKKDRYKVHPSLLELKGLVSLELWSCSIAHFPPNFGSGLKNLKNLTLAWTPMPQDRFELLMRSCPLLEEVVYCQVESYFPTLKIDAPRLSKFTFHGAFDEIIFVHKENLREVNFWMNWSLSEKSRELPPRVSCSNLVDVSRILSGVQSLRLLHEFSKYLIHGHVPERLPISFCKMTSLAIDVEPTCKREIQAILLILKACPRLTSLTISFEGTEDYDMERAKHFIEDDQRLLVLPEIRRVVALGFSDRFAELNLLELILRSSLKLEEVSVVDFISRRGTFSNYRSICRLRHASRQAKATILRRSSCMKGQCPVLVHWWLDGYDVPELLPFYFHSFPKPQVF